MQQQSMRDWRRKAGSVHVWLATTTDDGTCRLVASRTTLNAMVAATAVVRTGKQADGNGREKGRKGETEEEEGEGEG